MSKNCENITVWEVVIDALFGKTGEHRGEQSAIRSRNPESAAAIWCQRGASATRRAAIRSLNLYGDKFGSKI